MRKGIDEHPHPAVTVRRWFDEDRLVRADVFVGGWRVASLKTERGVTNRVRAEIAAIDKERREGVST